MTPMWERLPTPIYTNREQQAIILIDTAMVLRYQIETRNAEDRPGSFLPYPVVSGRSKSAMAFNPLTGKYPIRIF
jgi:hypothetical protein